MKTTPAQRMSALRARRKAAHITEYRAWVTASERAALDAVLASMRGEK